MCSFRFRFLQTTRVHHSASRIKLRGFHGWFWFNSGLRRTLMHLLKHKVSPVRKKQAHRAMSATVCLRGCRLFFRLCLAVPVPVLLCAGPRLDFYEVQSI